jgi:poly(A) polymerase
VGYDVDVSTVPLDKLDAVPAARAAVAIVRRLREAGQAALLAGGCVRDLLRGADPKDYDVATDAPPDRVCELFKPTRRVGAQFGVVLVKKRGTWVEVATFREDGPYLDGRRPSEVRLTDARRDALRRDFTINGMFLDPLDGRVLDYVGGRDDLEAGVVRAIGVPAQRFGEDYLRMLRAVRFAARLGYRLDTDTREAIVAHADRLPQVAAERIREELERMLAHASRAEAWRLLAACGLITELWDGAAHLGDAAERTAEMLKLLPAEADFVAALAIVLEEHTPRDADTAGRALSLSNEQREAVVWLVQQQAALDDPASSSLARLKRLMAGPAFSGLCQMAEVRYAKLADGDHRREVLQRRIAGVATGNVQPPPLVTGDDLKQRGIEAGPIYSRVLGDLYTRQLEEELTTREAALAALEEYLTAEE